MRPVYISAHFLRIALISCDMLKSDSLIPYYKVFKIIPETKPRVLRIYHSRLVSSCTNRK